MPPLKLARNTHLRLKLSFVGHHEWYKFTPIDILVNVIRKFISSCKNMSTDIFLPNTILYDHVSKSICHLCYTAQPTPLTSQPTLRISATEGSTLNTNKRWNLDRNTQLSNHVSLQKKSIFTISSFTTHPIRAPTIVIIILTFKNITKVFPPHRRQPTPSVNSPFLSLVFNC